MSRIIEFRAWDKEEKEYYYDVEYTYDFFCSGRGCYAESFGEVLNQPDRFIVEQFTGLLDRNGKKIYEGDIIESTWNGDKAEVVWNDVEGEWEHYADFNTHSKYSGSVVIGNIHESPELLGGEK